MKDEDYSEDSTVESWVMSKCDQWRDHYNTNYQERFDEYIIVLGEGYGIRMTLCVSQSVLGLLLLLLNKQ
jgi:hypothetical protein